VRVYTSLMCSPEEIPLLMFDWQCNQSLDKRQKIYCDERVCGRDLFTQRRTAGERAE